MKFNKEKVDQWQRDQEEKVDPMYRSACCNASIMMSTEEPFNSKCSFCERELENSITIHIPKDVCERPDFNAAAFIGRIARNTHPKPKK